MITIHQFDQSGRPTEGVSTLGSVTPPGHVRWVEAIAPTEAEFAELVSQFGLHPLAIEDTQHSGHPPKLEEFDEHLFLIVHTPSEDDDAVTRKLALFLGEDWLVTILRAPVAVLVEPLERLRAKPGRLVHGPADVFYRLIDLMTDGFEEHVVSISERLIDLEDRTDADPDDDTMRDIITLRNELAKTARVVRSQRDVAAMLSRGNYAPLPQGLIPYVRDVYDHLLRVHDQIEGARDQILAVRDLYLALVNNRLSEIMRVLTVIATIMMPLSLVAGIWGMNVGGLPGLHSTLGFWAVCGGMALLASVMLLWFRRRRWL